MKDISAVIIARNEEKMIRECIENVSFCDEVLVICNGTTDDTPKIAEVLGAKVFEISANDFSEIRNFGMQKAESKWVLYIDADERLDEQLAKEIKDAIKNEEYSSFILQRKNYYLGKNEWPYIEKMQRLFKKSDFVEWVGQIHETAVSNGKSKILSGFLLHFTHRDLESMVEKTLEWSTIEARTRLRQNHPQMSWWRFPRVMLTAFFKSYFLQRGYKARTVGIIESTYQAFSIFITYAKLWEMQKHSLRRNDIKK